MRTIRIVTLISSSFILAACSLSSQTENDATTSAPNSDTVISSSVATLTRNVSFTGRVEDLGPSIYMQGTHKLALEDGRFILLDAASADVLLPEYVGEQVEATGSTETTVEGGATILHVERIVRLLSDSASSASMASSAAPQYCGGIAALECSPGYTCVDDTTDSCDPMNGGADCSGLCLPSVMASSSSVTSSVAASMKASSSALSSSARSVSSVAFSSSVSSAAISSSVSSSVISSKEAVIALMAKRKDYASQERWPKKYCSMHIGFCVPVYKNWYYISFGANGGSLWHVEFSEVDFSSLGEGVIMLDLKKGSSLSSAIRDGAVEVNGTTVIGYKDWGEEYHFEVSADARLKSAVQYLIDNIHSAQDQ